MATIRLEQSVDREGVHALHRSCFPTAGEARLVDLLRLAGRLRISLIAEVDGEIVGHVGFSPVTVARGSIGVGLAPLAVVESHRNKGIAAAMVREGLNLCRDAGFGWMVVLGEPAYYSRFGFRPASEVGLSDEYGGGDAFQAIELVPGEMPHGAGLVRYAPEFASLE